MVTQEFSDRIALVTGGSRGIGRATALELAKRGAAVAVGYASRKETAEEVTAEIEALGSRAICGPCDLRKQSEIDEFVAKTRTALGPIDLLVNSGAICTVAEHQHVDSQLWLDTIDANLNGAYRILFAVKDEMLERQYGRVVLLSSVAGLRPRKAQLHYSVSKAGVVALTRCCGEAFAPHVRVNCIAPGLIDTEMAHCVGEEKMAALVEQTPLGRIGQPEEIAAVACFLLSDASSFMTGQTVVASGGRITVP